MQGTLSIVIPIHNVENFLDKCLESVSRVSLDGLKVMLVVNASTDSSLDICRAWADKDSRFEIFCTDTPGVSNARNIGLENCNTDYIAFIDADDYIDCDAFVDCFKKCIETNADISFSAYYRVKNEKAKVVRLPLESKIFKGNEITSEIIQQKLAPNINFFGVVWRTFFKRSILQGIEFNLELAYHEDVIFMIKASLNASTAIIIQKPYYYYRINSKSASGNERVNNSENRRKFVKHLENIAKENHLNLAFAIAQRKADILIISYKEILRSSKGVINKMKRIHQLQSAVTDSEISYWEPDCFGKTMAIYMKLMKRNLRLFALLFLFIRFFIFK